MFRAQHALAALDVRRGERVALVVNDEPAFPAWFLGALRSGVVPVPLSTMLTPGELAAIVADAGAGVAVVSSAYAPYVDALAAADAELRHAVVDRHAGRRRQPSRPTPGTTFTDADEPPVAATTADSPAFWLYSSGTTGHAEGRHAPPRQPAGDGRDVRPRGPRRSAPTTAACRSPSCSSPTGSATR